VIVKVSTKRDTFIQVSFCTSGLCHKFRVGRVACTGETRNVYKILIGKPEGKRLLRRFSRSLENNIKMDLKGNRVGRYGLDSSGSG
jgi:hypothetical protein